MKKLMLESYGEPKDVVRLVEEPTRALGAGELLVRMEAAPINPSDFLLVRGHYAVRPEFPYAVGAEGYGRVVRVGGGVERSLEGRAVVVLPSYEVGTWADEVIVSLRHIVPVADATDPIQLAMLGINPSTAYLLLSRFTTLMPGDIIAQTAANSAMGQNVIALARLMGVRTLNVVRRPEAAAAVKAIGGDRVVQEGEQLGAEIDEALGGKKLALVLDNVGGASVGALASRLKTGGTIIGYGLESGEFPKIGIGDLYLRSLRLQGFWLIDWLRSAPRADIEEVYGRLAELVNGGVLNVAIDAAYPLAEYGAAFVRASESRRSGKVVFRF